MLLRLASTSFAAAVCAASSLAPSAAAQCVVTLDASIGGTHNPFLAGQPVGTALGQDVVPDQAPHQVSLTLAGGELLRFGDVSGQLHGEPPTIQQIGTWGADGDTAQIAMRNDALGISGFTMPLDALLGVFMTDATNAGAIPETLDFGTANARDFERLQPAMFQVFFIGDGLREDGISLQSFEVPAGATRLFLGSADSGEWNDNFGTLQMSIEQEVADITPFCTAKVSSEGCLPSIGYTGYPALAGTHEFEVLCAEISPKTKGTLFYGHAQYVQPFQGGFLCTNGMVKRTPIAVAPQTLSGAPCSSAFTFDFNAWIQGGNDPTLVPGEVIYAQWWIRDPGALSKTGLSDALEIQLCQ